MKSNDKKISLTLYDDIFQSDESRIEAQQERVANILLAELHSFKHHPFKVVDDEAMKDAIESIAKFGVLVPVIARPREEGGYELISGHRCKRTSELADKDTMPVTIRKLDVDFINASEVLEDDADFQNPVDLMFAALEGREPNHFAVRQYKKFKLAAGKTAKSILTRCGAHLAPLDIPDEHNGMQ